MMCNGQHITWNLRNPLRALLGATAQVLGGVVHSHLSYSQEHERTAQHCAHRFQKFLNPENIKGASA